MGPVEEFLTSRFLLLYGAPDSIDPPAFAAEYAKALCGTAPDILREAADLIVKQHKYRNWPTVGECVEMVNSVANRRMNQRRREAWGYSREVHEPPTPEAKARIDQIVQGVKQQLLSHDRPMRPSLPAIDRVAWDNRLEHSATAQALARIPGGEA